MRSSSSWEIRDPITVNNGLALHHGHHANRDNWVHPPVRTVTRRLERDLREILDVILCGRHRLVSCSRGPLMAIRPGDERPCCIHENEVSVVCLQGVASVELGVRLLIWFPGTRNQSGDLLLGSCVYAIIVCVCVYVKKVCYVSCDDKKRGELTFDELAMICAQSAPLSFTISPLICGPRTVPRTMGRIKRVMSGPWTLGMIVELGSMTATSR